MAIAKGLIVELKKTSSRPRNSQKERLNRRKHSTKSVAALLSESGYRLTSEFTTVRNAFTYLCPQGHEGKTYLPNWTRGVRCAKCKKEGAASKRRHSIEYVRNLFQKENYELLSREYKNNSQKLDYKCPVGHIHSITFSDWKTGHRCAACAGNKKKSSFEIGELLGIQGYKLIDPYCRASDRVVIECPKKHRFKAKWNNFQQGNRCPRCASVQSKGELEVIETYSHLNLKERDRTQIKPLELDLYFPDHQIAIEYCGLYWHSEYAPGDRITPNYHRNKLDLCNQKGIQLLTIFEDEWLDHKDICISRINNALGISSQRIYGRNTIAKELPKKEAKEFLNRTHLQGYGRCKIAYGLYHNNKLVSVMTWGSPARAHTAKGKRVLEMKRFASELDTTVIGGASKLLKLGLQYAKDNEYDSLKSYCDLRWGTGNLYKKLGFTKTYETKCTPHYTNGVQRLRNQNLAVNKKKEKITETEKAREKGLYKIYDCGHSTWEQVL